MEILFVRGGTLFPATRTRPLVDGGVARLALATLVAGTTRREEAAGIRSYVPSDTRFSLAVAGGTARVDLSRDFFTGDDTTVQFRQAQVVYTLTQYPTISSVRFLSGGEPMGGPWARTDFTDPQPPIVVLQPSIGQIVSSPVTVSGTANVFEATVSVRILDAAGAELATTFTTATCGSGCRGVYSVDVAFTVDAEQPATIEVYEVSAKDGSRTHVVTIPVTLTP